MPKYRETEEKHEVINFETVKILAVDKKNFIQGYLARSDKVVVRIRIIDN
jgi:hypothetical protein